MVRAAVTTYKSLSVSVVPAEERLGGSLAPHLNSREPSGNYLRASCVCVILPQLQLASQTSIL